MAALLFRIALISIGLGLAELSIDGLAQTDAFALPELVIALGLLVAGSAGFIVPLFAGHPDRGGRRP